jgi:hypothetical protein
LSILEVAFEHYKTIKNIFFAVFFLLSFIFCLVNINKAAVPYSSTSTRRQLP